MRRDPAIVPAFAMAAMSLALYIALVLVVSHRLDNLRRTTNEMRQQLCAWRFEEDGSASVRADDFDRYRCMTEHGYRAR